MTGHLDFETLMAYADGELSPERSAEVERAAAADPQAEAALRDLQAAPGLLKGAYGPVPAELPDGIGRRLAVERPARDGYGLRQLWWSSAVAAVLAVLLVGLPGVYLLQDRAKAGLRQDLAAEVRSDRRYLASAVGQALEHEISGSVLPWKNPESGSEGQVMPVRSFRSAEGQWCREYVAQGQVGILWDERRAIACREGEGVWRTRIERIEDRKSYAPRAPSRRTTS